MAYMVEDFYREGAVLDYPKGGSKGLIDALARGVTKHEGCDVQISSSVEEVLVEDGKAVGVKLAKSGRIIRAKQAVVSNADLKMTYDLVKTPHEGLDEERQRLMGAGINKKGVPLCKSFMHVHAGIKADLIPDDAPAQWTVVKDWSLGIDAPGNVIVVSCPSKLDPSLAPPGYHVIHAYGAGNEPYEAWEHYEDLDAKGRASSTEYQEFKKERAQPIWDAIARRAPLVVPGVAVVEQIGTPLTHGRFLKRHRGNYGLAIAADSKFKFPEVTTPLSGYYRCGDSTTSGIGVPAVASSGAQCANALLSVWEQLELNKKIKM
jgi:phytoene dehydrogenase-like protein